MLVLAAVVAFLYFDPMGLKLLGFTDSQSASVGNQGVVAAEEMGNEGQMAVKGMDQKPTTCYPQQTLKPEDLLPADQAKASAEFASSAVTAEGLMNVNMLKAGEHIGVNTVGQSLRNANRQLRSEPPNPQVNVSPWMNTNIGPDLMRRPLEDGEGCAASAPADASGAAAVTGAGAPVAA